MNPSLTPLTMLFKIARLNPCSALASASSPSRLTLICAPSTTAEVRLGNSKSSLPFGPSTNTFRSFTSTLTLAGISIGNLPILDINQQRVGEMERWSLGVLAPAIRLHSTAPLLQYSVIMLSPDVANQFAAQVLFAGLRARHHAARGRDNRCAHASEHARNLCRANRSEEHTSELQSQSTIACRLLLAIKN